MIKILIADDHSLVRQGVKQIAALATDIAVAGEAVNGWEVLEQLQKTACHLLLLDISMPGINGIDLIRRVKEERPLLPILMLSMYSEGHLAARAIKAGASGYVTKDSEPETLIAAIRRVAGGGRYVEPRLAEQMALEFSLADERPPHETLSEREFQVLENRTAAENMDISMEVSYKKPSIMRKRVADLLEQLNLSDKRDTITGELSRGEQQRVTLARAVANSPTLILVDEPTGNLDAITTERVMKLLNKCNNSGATVVIATHDDSIYRNTPHRVMELSKGRMHAMHGGMTV